MFVLATLQNYSQEILARCPNGYHVLQEIMKSMIPPKGFQDAIMVITEVHRDIVKKSVGLTAPPKNVQVGITKMKILVSV